MATTTRPVHGGECMPATPTVAEPSSGALRVATAELGKRFYPFDPRFTGASAQFRRGYSVADRIHRLHEPWRTRFVELIAQRVNATLFPGRLPSRTQIAVWLSDQQLSRLIRLMLRAWTSEEW